MKSIIKNFKSYCDDNNLRITPPREYVLEIIASSAKPMTAYDILDELGKKLNKPKPPTAYRALEFLGEHGFIHRIESLNAYVVCHENHKHEGGQFLICDSCGAVEEIHLCTMPKTLQEKVKSQGFNLHHWNVEVHGKCKAC
tara:strand:- start:4668 stop:5090 length:423 start_codon:yes stop_codon:yes gene_type:complete